MDVEQSIAQARRIVDVAQAHLRSLLLEALVERNGSVNCQYCGVPTIAGDPGYRGRTLDHIHPLSKGGKDELENAALVCRSCNSRKGTRPQREYAVMR